MKVKLESFHRFLNNELRSVRLASERREAEWILYKFEKLFENELKNS